MANKFDELIKELRLLKKEMELQRLHEVEERTIFIKIHFEIYPISCEILGQMFSGMGVESIDRLGEGGQFHSRIRFPNRDSAVEALNWFNGRCIYHECCQLELFLESTLRSHDKLVEELHRERADRTILIKMHFELYPISREVLDWFFYGIGNLESIECFDQGNPFHSRICFQDRDSAVRAVHWLGGRCIYNGCCQVELILEAETIDRAREMDVSNQRTLEDSGIDEHGKRNPSLAIVDEPQDYQKGIEEPIKDVSQERDSPDDYVLQEVPYKSSRRISDEQGIQRLNFASVDELKAFQKEIEVPGDEIEEDPKELQIEFESSKVISQTPSSLEVALVEVATKRMDESAEDPNGRFSFESTRESGTEIRTDFRRRSVEFLEFLSAHKLFVRMSRQGESSMAIAKYRGQLMKSVFDPGIVEIRVEDSIGSTEMGGDLGSLENIMRMGGYLSKNTTDWVNGRVAHKVFEEMPNSGIDVMGLDSRDFRRKNVVDMVEVGKVISYCVESSSTTVGVHMVLAVSVVFDPGIATFCVEHSCSHIIFDPGGVLGPCVLEDGQRSFPYDRGRVPSCSLLSIFTRELLVLVLC